jgi:hypothetical protein
MSESAKRNAAAELGGAVLSGLFLPISKADIRGCVNLNRLKGDTERHCRMSAINGISMSNASDLEYLALADVVAAGIDTATYRIVGGHMVQLLIHVYPTPEATERSTADADAGIKQATAVGQELHEHLLARGCTETSGGAAETSKTWVFFDQSPHWLRHCS